MRHRKNISKARRRELQQEAEANFAYYGNGQAPTFQPQLEDDDPFWSKVDREHEESKDELRGER